MTKYDQIPMESEPIDVLAAEPAAKPSLPKPRRSMARTLLLVLGGIGLGVGLLFAAAVVLVLVFGEAKEIKLKGGSQLIYTSTVKESEARKLGDWLEENVLSKAAADAPARSFQLSKKGDAYELRVCVQDGAEQNKLIVLAWELAGPMISEQVFDKAPVNVYLCDDHLKDVLAIPHLDAPKPADKP